MGTPTTGTSTHAWMKSLPFVAGFYGSAALELPAQAAPEWPPARLRDCQPQWADFVRQTLQWQPQERRTAASASRHSFLSRPALSVPVAVAKGKTGLGSIAAGALDDDLVEYLQQCPTWKKSVAECLERNFQPNLGINREEGLFRMKREFVGYNDADNPPKCKSLNGDANLLPIRFERLALFVKALRRGAKNWLHQLTARVRAEILRQKLPPEFLNSNGRVFMEEDFADNAFVYSSVQFLKIGAREDGWHTDGGTSLLNAAVTVFGSRTLLVKLEDESCISFPQRLGSFSVGHLCALNHNVAHGEHAAGSYGEGPPSEQVQIAVMLRSDVFRAARARRINCTPGPSELYHIVNSETARHLAEQPFHLPDLAAVIAESREAGSPSA